MVTAPQPKRIGGWIQTFTNKQFWPLDPRVNEINIVDIAHALSNMSRFAGHCHEFYSVAQHSCLVALHCPPEYRFAGLMHDAEEGLGLPDLATPIKKYLKEYVVYQVKLSKCIGLKFNVQLEPLHPVVKEQDHRALLTEKRDLRGPEPSPWGLPPGEPWPETIVPWSSAKAKATFLFMFGELYRG